jgi:hypothetical protein
MMNFWKRLPRTKKKSACRFRKKISDFKRGSEALSLSFPAFVILKMKCWCFTHTYQLYYNSKGCRVNEADRNEAGR